MRQTGEDPKLDMAATELAVAADWMTTSRENKTGPGNQVADLEYVGLDGSFGCFRVQSDHRRVDELEGMYAQIFVKDCYFREGISLLPNAFVIDIGANVGLFSLYVHSRQPDARVLAFEPVPSTYHALRANLEHHGADKITAVECALGANQETDVEFTFFPGLPSNSSRYPEVTMRSWDLLEMSSDSALRAILGEQHVSMFKELLADGQKVKVAFETLSSALAQHDSPRTIDLVKIDVEGAERDVLAGIAEPDWGRIQQVVAEVHDLDGGLSEVRTLLEDHGFHVSVVPQTEFPELRVFMVYARRTSGPQN